MENLTHEKYQQALTNVRILMKLKPTKNSVEGLELERLITLIEAYEEIYVPMNTIKEPKE